MLSKEAIEELERLEKEASDAPWEFNPKTAAVYSPFDDFYAYLEPFDLEERKKNCRSLPHQISDGQFIVAMRNALPEVLAEVRRLQQEYKDLMLWTDQRHEHDQSILRLATHTRIELQKEIEELQSENSLLKLRLQQENAKFKAVLEWYGCTASDLTSNCDAFTGWHNGEGVFIEAIMKYGQKARAALGLESEGG